MPRTDKTRDEYGFMRKDTWSDRASRLTFTSVLLLRVCVCDVRVRTEIERPSGNDCSPIYLHAKDAGAREDG